MRNSRHNEQLKADIEKLISHNLCKPINSKEHEQLHPIAAPVEHQQHKVPTGKRGKEIYRFVTRQKR